MPAPKDPVANALWKQRMSESRAGKKRKPLSEEHKAKISKTRIERGVAAGENNPMFGISLPGYWKGKNMPMETRQKLSVVMSGKGHTVSEETKEKLRKALSGKPKSEEHKQKLRDSHLGKPSWNKGLHFSEETKQKMSKAKLGKIMSDGFKQKRSEIMKEKWKDPLFKQDMVDKHSGENNYNFGGHISEYHKQVLIGARKKDWESQEYIENQKITHTGYKHTDDAKNKMSESRKGDKCYNWKGGITKLNLHIRALPRYKNICSDLMKEVDYTDKFTGIRGGVLACHHIIPQNVIIRMYDIKTIDDARNCPLLFDKHNMIVMLASAHDKFHNIYGDNKNIYELTPEQIKELYL